MELAVVQKFANRQPTRKLGKLIGKVFVDMYDLDFYEDKAMSKPVKDGDNTVGVLRFRTSLRCQDPIELPEILWSALRPITANTLIRLLCCWCLLCYHVTNIRLPLKRPNKSRRKPRGKAKNEKQRGYLRACSLTAANWRCLMHMLSIGLLSFSVWLLYELRSDEVLKVLKVVVMSKLLSIFITEPASLLWEYYSLKLLCPCLLPEYEKDEEEYEEEEGVAESDAEHGEAPVPHFAVQAPPGQPLQQPLLGQPAAGRS